MENGKHLVYEFGGFQLDPARHTLCCHGRPVALAPKLFETLILLVENRERILPKDELMQALWADTFVEEGNLSQNIFLLRKVLGDDRNGHSFIHTIPRKGYRFVAAVTESEVEAYVSLPGGREADYWKQNSPFRSLRVFEEEDAWLFFGREAETADLLSRLSRSPVVAVVGNSGSGKSSLLRAGLIPALREGRFPDANGSPAARLPGECWRIAVVRPSASPFDYLAEVLPAQLAPELDVKEQVEFIADCREKLPSGGDALRNAISALVFAATDQHQPAGSTRVLLIVDQFEELFTLTATSAVRDCYIGTLLAATRTDGAVPVHLVIVLRADFYGHCLDHPGLRRCLETSFNLGCMTPGQMRQTIEQRLVLAGGRAEPGLIDSLLEDVGAEPGNLALLEHALGQLWEQCGRAGCTFTSHAYAQMGRLRGALGRHADSVLASLDEEQKPIAQKIFLELVHLGEGAQDTRRRVAKSELLRLGEPAQVDLLLQELASSRLISTGREGEETFVEVSHEALIREWPALRQWLEENREDLSLERRLEQASEEWQGLQRDPGALLQGTRLAQAEDWLARHWSAAESVRAYIDSSIQARVEFVRKERDAQRRELRRFRWFSYALGVLFLVSVATSAFVYHLRILEKSRAMAARAEELAIRDHGQAFDMAIASWGIAQTADTRFAVAKTFPELLYTANHDGDVNVAVFSADGLRILSASLDHTAKLWDARDGGLLAVLRHDGTVQHAGFSRDGTLIITASEQEARVWSGIDGHLIAVLRGHTGPIWWSEFSPDGRRVVTASEDHTSRIWDSLTGHLLATLQGHKDAVVDARFSPNGKYIVTASSDKTAAVWNSADGSLVLRLSGHSKRVMYASFSPDGDRIITGSWDNTARVWNAGDGRLLYVLNHDALVVWASFSSDGRVVTASHDRTARVWNATDGHLLLRLQHEGSVEHAEFSADGRYILTASSDQTARVWNSTKGQLLAVLGDHSAAVYHANFSPDSTRIVTASRDHRVRVWSMVVSWPRLTLAHESSVQDATFSGDGKAVLTGGRDRKVRLWNTEHGDIAKVLPVPGMIWLAILSPDGKMVVTTGDKDVPVWDTTESRLRFFLKGHSDTVVRASFSPDGHQLLTSSFDGTVRVWNMVDGRLRAVLTGHQGQVWDARFSPDGLRIVSAATDHTARLWSATDFQLLRVLKGHTDEVHSAEFSPDGRSIVTASFDHTARVWSSVDGHLLAVLQCPAPLNSAHFSGDGQSIVTSGMDENARIWNSADGRLLAILAGHRSQVMDAWFSPDDRRIITASVDETARVWNRADGHLITTLQGHTGPVWQARFSADGRHLITASMDQTARIWEILTLDDIERILSK